MEEAWPRMRLTVHIATRLNRSHLFPGAVSYVLPCLGRSEEDRQASGPQTVSMEDSLSCIHGSRATHAPAAKTLLSEVAIVAGSPRPRCRPIPSCAGMNGWEITP